MELATADSFPVQDQYPDYEAYADAVKTWETTHEHRATDGTPIKLGARFWDNNLRVVEITRVGNGMSRTYSDTGEISTWHETTGGSSDTLTGYMAKYGRLTGTFEGKKASDYPAGTNYSEVK